MLPNRFGGQGKFSTVGELKQSGVTGVQTGANQNHFELGGQTEKGFENIFNSNK